MESTGLTRTEAAQWACGATGYTVTESNLRYWEGLRLLRPQSPGRRVPALYQVDDLTRLRLIVELRQSGAPLQRIRKAVSALARLFPEIHARPGAWRLVVTASGDIVHVGKQDLFDLSRRPGQGGWLFLLDAGQYLRDSERALARVTA